MCFTIFKNNNGPMLIEKLTPQCDSVSRLICGKRTLAEIDSNCRFNPHLLNLTEEEIKKISSDAQYTYRCYAEMLEKKSKK